MKNLNIARPTLLLDKQKCLNNISQMSDKAKHHRLIFRPHFKTHQSAEVGNWFRDFGIKSITVSSVKMAAFFAKHGWDDITIAFPVNLREISEINILASKIKLNLLVESETIVDFLNNKLTTPAGVFIKIDTGYHRTGIIAEDVDLIERMVRKITTSKKLTFRGFLTHSGNTYYANSLKEIDRIHHNSIRKLKSLRKAFSDKSDHFILSIGDTPSCSMMDDFEGTDEIRPGNFVFYDVMQYKLGSCAIDDIAVCMVCPVVAKNDQRNEVVIYGGAIHFSKESLLLNDTPVFGLVVELNNQGWLAAVTKKSFVKSISQEHGVIKVNTDLFNKIKVGDLVGVLPVHSCLAVSEMRRYYTLEGEEISTINFEC